MTATITATATDIALAEMMTENTGRHFLDSGGAYGRRWEQNQGKTVETFLARPEARIDRYCGVMVDTFHWLRDRLEYDAELDARLVEFISGREDTSYLQDAEDFGPEVLGISPRDVRTWNSYNYDNVLDETLQAVEFGDIYENVWVYNDETEESEDYGDVVLLQWHGGCDVRGGYTRPRAFRKTSESDLYDQNDFSLYCPGPPATNDIALPGMPEVREEQHALDFRGEWITAEGSFETTQTLWPDAEYSSDFVTEDEDGEPVVWCPWCKRQGIDSRMTAHAPYAC